jgi:hypothetical protein
MATTRCLRSADPQLLGGRYVPKSEIRRPVALGIDSSRSLRASRWRSTGSVVRSLQSLILSYKWGQVSSGFPWSEQRAHILNLEVVCPASRR